jgi:RimJ/RimL family protein N-acetyltransferase
LPIRSGLRSGPLPLRLGSDPSCPKQKNLTQSRKAAKRNRAPIEPPEQRAVSKICDLLFVPAAAGSFYPARMLTSARLQLRPWRDEDLPAFAALNADPEVMEYMPECLAREESDALAARIREGLARRGFGLWAVEVIGVSEFIGFTGLSVPSYETHFTPCVEIAWRLARKYWGFGYATEAAHSAMDYGFRTVGLEEIVSFTFVENLRSRRVMERLGMTHSPADDFDHPRLPEGHRIRPHVLYRMNREAWMGSKRS